MGRPSESLRQRARGAAAAAALGLGFVACSLAAGDGSGERGSALLGDADGDASVDADAGPRRVCPSARDDDGGWITVEGMDTSDWEFADWDEVHANQPNIRFSIVRVASSILRVDTRFHADWAGTKRVGLIRGAYQYFVPRYSAVAQADLFLQRLRDEGGLQPDDLPPVLDVETSSDMPDAVVVCRMKLWLARVEREVGRVPIIYTSAAWSSYFGPEMSRYPLWVANYVGSPQVTCPRTPDAWDHWRLWQHAEDGGVRGLYSNGDRDGDGGGAPAVDDSDGGDGGPIAADSDMNLFDGRIEDLTAFIAGTVSPGTVANPPPPSDPPHVPTPDGGSPVDCSDGCCVADP